MATYLVFGRHAYDEPLTGIGMVEAVETPTIDAVGQGDDWLELVVVPEQAVIWVLREADLVRRPRSVGT